MLIVKFISWWNIRNQLLHFKNQVFRIVSHCDLWWVNLYDHCLNSIFKSCFGGQAVFFYFYYIKVKGQGVSIEQKGFIPQYKLVTSSATPGPSCCFSWRVTRRGSAQPAASFSFGVSQCFSVTQTRNPVAFCTSHHHR